jgi:hypothetical protein
MKRLETTSSMRQHDVGCSEGKGHRFESCRVRQLVILGPQVT